MLMVNLFHNKNFSLQKFNSRGTSLKNKKKHDIMIACWGVIYLVLTAKSDSVVRLHQVFVTAAFSHFNSLSNLWSSLYKVP